MRYPNTDNVSAQALSSLHNMFISYLRENISKFSSAEEENLMAERSPTSYWKNPE